MQWWLAVLASAMRSRKDAIETSGTTAERRSSRIMLNPSLHVVLGAGQIGTTLARVLADAGHRVRIVARREGDAIPGVERVRADLSDPRSAAASARGATVIYGCTNVAYDRWDEELPPLIDAAVAAARDTGARLVVLDNLYAFGRTAGAPMRPEGPFEPCSRKGALRKRLAERLLDAHARGDAPVAIARGSDFVGPGIVRAHLGERFFQRVFAGKPGECLGDPDQPHAFTYGDDVARGLATLGTTDRAVDGRIWHLPTLEARSMRGWASALGGALAMEVRVEPLPGWMLAALGLISPVMRELREMRYQWEEPYLVDDSAFRRELGLQPTPLDEQVRATAAWARATYGARRALAA
jgi:nucleoside-diphosphate-sugar epimerase